LWILQWRLDLRELGEQRPRLRKVGRLRPLREAAEDVGEGLPRLIPPTPQPEQPAEACGRPQLPGLRPLLTRNLKGMAERQFGLLAAPAPLQEEKLTAEPAEVGSARSADRPRPS
jgi:hypothetical protein